MNERTNGTEVWFAPSRQAPVVQLGGELRTSLRRVLVRAVACAELLAVVGPGTPHQASITWCSRAKNMGFCIGVKTYSNMFFMVLRATGEVSIIRGSNSEKLDQSRPNMEQKDAKKVISATRSLDLRLQSPVTSFSPLQPLRSGEARAGRSQVSTIRPR